MTNKFKAWKGAEVWPLDQIKPSKDNPKSHPPEQVTALAGIFVEHGPDQPIVVDEDGVVIKGHGRLLAAYEAGLSEYPVFIRRGLTEIQKKALRISDNAIAEKSGWIEDLLRVDLNELSLAGYDMPLIGFEHEELIEYMAQPPVKDVDPDKTPAPPIKPVSAAEDLWLLGNHRLLVGDSSKDEDVARVLNGQKPAATITDPPYEMETEGGGLFGSGKVSHARAIKAANIHQFSPSDLKLESQVNVFFTSKPLVPAYIALAVARGLAWDLAVMHRGAAVPNHGGHLMSDLDYIVLIGKLAPQKGLAHADYSKLFSEPTHWERPVPWAKPISTMSRLVRLFSRAGGIVYEPYCGSGTTLIAAEMTKRRCFAIEKAAAYADVTILRWQELTGTTAVLDGDGRTFEQITKARAKSEKSRSRQPRSRQIDQAR